LAASAGGGASEDAEAQFRQKELEALIRFIEGAPLLLPEEQSATDDQVEGRNEALRLYADAAAEIASDADTPAQYREQAAAVWLIFRDPDTTTDLTALLPPPEEQTALAHWVTAAGDGEGLDAESLAGLRDVEMSAWLRSRLSAYASAPDKALQADSTHAHAEKPYLERAFSLFSVYFLAFVTGCVLMVFVGLRWRRLQTMGLVNAPAPGWGDSAWVGWFVLMAWFSVSFTSQMVVGGVISIFGLDGGSAAIGLLVQVGAGVFAIWLLMGLSTGERTWQKAIGDLRVGLEPFRNRVSTAILWALAGFAVAVPVVYGSVVFVSLLPIESELVSNPALPELVNPKGPISQLLLSVSVVVAAPIFEEIVFRGVLYRQLRGRLGLPGATLLSAAVFAAVHFSVTSFMPLFALGALLAVIAERSGGLLPSMLVHALWNGGTILIATTFYGA